MNKDDKPMKDDELLDLMEQLVRGDAASWEDARQKGCLQDFQDLKLLAAASRAERETNSVEERLAAFHAAQRRKRRQRVRRLTLLFTGVAATVCALLLWALPFGQHSGNSEQPLVVFLSDSTVSPHAVLRTEASRQKPDVSKRQDATRTWTLSAPNEIDYHARQPLVAEARTLPSRHSLTVPRGQTFKIILADGTEVYMNTDSRLVYPDRFTGKERCVYLEGEAYFKVAKDKEHPFIVRTRTLQTRVLGTEFNVSSYADSDTQVTLIEGSVEVSDGRRTTTRIRPGEQASLHTDGNFSVQKVDVSSYVHWKEGYFYYDDVTLLDILKDLGRWYNVSVVVCNAEAMDCRLHYVADRREDLQHAVTLLNRMQKFKITLKDDRRLYVE